MIDFIIDLPLSKKKNNMFDLILIIVNRFTKIARYILINKIINALELADIFLKQIITRFGILKGIISDHSLVFISRF